MELAKMFWKFIRGALDIYCNLISNMIVIVPLTFSASLNISIISWLSGQEAEINLINLGYTWTEVAGQTLANLPDGKSNTHNGNTVELSVSEGNTYG